MFGMEHWPKGTEINRTKVNLKIALSFSVKPKTNWVMIGYDYLWTVSPHPSMSAAGWTIVRGSHILSQSKTHQTSFLPHS